MSGIGPQGHRCSTCAFTFPVSFEACQICGGNLWNTYMDGPHDNWQEELAWRLLNSPVEDEDEEEKDELDIMFEPDVEWELNSDEAWAELVPHRPDNTAELYSWGSLLWVKHDDLLALDYWGITEDTIVFINGEFFELQGFHEASRGWWIEPIVIDATNLTPEQIIASGEA